MRVLQELVRFYFENKQFDKSINTLIEMLRLCPIDNLGRRDWLGAVLLKAGRSADALSFVETWLRDEVLETEDPPPRGGCIFYKPIQQPLTKAKFERLKTRCRAGMTYSAALASFKLWGDCELARQYLIISAEQGGLVLLKILAKVNQPSYLKPSLNSSDPTRDYLWLAQDQWMAEDVWNWANSVTAAKAHILKHCSRGGCPNREITVSQFKRCGACHEVWYCTQDCQKADWETHKPRCIAHRREEMMDQSIMTGHFPKGAEKLFS